MEEVELGAPVADTKENEPGKTIKISYAWKQSSSIPFIKNHIFMKTIFDRIIYSPTNSTGFVST